MTTDLNTAMTEYSHANNHMVHAGKHEGLRQFAGAEFQVALKREALNEALAKEVMRMQDFVQDATTKLDAIGEPAAHFLPTISLAAGVVSDLRAMVIEDHSDRLELGHALMKHSTSLEDSMQRLSEKLARLAA